MNALAQSRNNVNTDLREGRPIKCTPYDLIGALGDLHATYLARLILKTKKVGHLPELTPSLRQVGVELIPRCL